MNFSQLVSQLEIIASSIAWSQDSINARGVNVAHMLNLN